jgi:hypothetical protein
MNPKTHPDVPHESGVYYLDTKKNIAFDKILQYKLPFANGNNEIWSPKVKMRNVVKTSEGNVTIHFNYNAKTGVVADFKFK